MIGATFLYDLSTDYGAFQADRVEAKLIEMGHTVTRTAGRIEVLA